MSKERKNRWISGNEREVTYKHEFVSLFALNWNLFMPNLILRPTHTHTAKDSNHFAIKKFAFSICNFSIFNILHFYQMQ